MRSSTREQCRERGPLSRIDGQPVLYLDHPFREPMLRSLCSARLLRAVVHTSAPGGRPFGPALAAIPVVETRFVSVGVHLREGPQEALRMA